MTLEPSVLTRSLLLRKLKNSEASSLFFKGDVSVLPDVYESHSCTFRDSNSFSDFFRVIMDLSENCSKVGEF